MYEFPKVSDKQAAILRFLNKWKYQVDGAPDAKEIARMYRGSHSFTPAQVSSALKALEAKGLTEKLGVSFTGGRCHGITDLGRALGDKLEAEDREQTHKSASETMRRMREAAAAKREQSGPKV